MSKEPLRAAFLFPAVQSAWHRAMQSARQAIRLGTMITGAWLAAAAMPGQARAGFDFVLIGRQATLTRPFPALVGDVTAALARLGATSAAPQKQES